MGIRLGDSSWYSMIHVVTLKNWTIMTGSVLLQVLCGCSVVFGMPANPTVNIV
jgi:hypothetical protein